MGSDETASQGRGWLTLRSLVLGGVMCAAIGWIGPYWTLYLQTSRMFADYHTAGATFGLFLIFLLVNLGLGSIWRGAALKAHELMTVGAMMLVGGSIVTSGLIAYFIPSITAPYHLADASNQWNTLLWPELPAWMSPLDPNGGTVAIRKFWDGLPRGEPIPWGPWVQPLLMWGVFLMAFFACMIAIMSIMRKQWVDYEHLSFPIAQVPGELCVAAADPSGPSSIFRSAGFWIGVGTSLALASAGGLGNYFGILSEFRIRAWIGQEPWRVPVYLDLVVIGLVFLIPNRVAFSVWILAFGAGLLTSFMTAYNLREVSGAEVYSNEIDHLAMGATIVFVATSLWLSRGHLKRALRCAFGRGESGYDAGEPASYLSAFLLFGIGLSVAVAWFTAAGLGLIYSVLLLVITLVIFYAMARVVAQCGLPMASPPIDPGIFLASTVGTQSITARQACLMAMHYGWHFDIRNSPMSGAAHGMYLARRRRGGLLWAMLLGLAISGTMAAICAVWVSYRHGGSQMDGWFFITFPRYTVWPWAQRVIMQRLDPSFQRMLWGGAGALLMALLVLAQRSLFWWPLHPVGLIICSSHMVHFFWASVFAAWLIKYLLVKFGGPPAYRGGRRVFIGLVMGYFLGGGGWAIIDTLTQTTGNSVFYI